MQSPLSQRDYFSDGVLALEQERIFRKLWIFAGLRQLLSGKDAFATRTVGGTPVLLRNCGGRIVALENQCLHRQMPLQWEDYGTRPLVCRYHGWSYDDEGVPAHIPESDRLYAYTEREKSGLRLRRFAVECVGNMVFVNLDEHPLPIGEQFSAALLARLAEVSSCFDDEVIHTRISARYNWKLNFENVLDGNHVRYLHPRTFMPYMADPSAAEEPQAVETPVPAPSAERLHRCRLPDLSYESIASFKVVPRHWHRNVQRFGDKDLYYNFFIYPNVNFISVGGYLFLVQQFSPVTAGETEVSFSLMTAKKIRRIPASAAILWAHIRGEKAVLDEDIRALETLQSRLHEGGRVASHGAYESQLLMNHAVYRRLMAGAAP